MAFHVFGPTRQAAIDFDGEVIVERLPRELGITAPQCERIWREFYGHPDLGGPADVSQWRTELVALRDAWCARRRDELIRERKIQASDPAVVDRIVGGLLAKEPLPAIFDELIAVCDDALAAGVGLRLAGD